MLQVSQIGFCDPCPCHRFCAKLGRALHSAAATMQDAQSDFDNLRFPATWMRLVKTYTTHGSRFSWKIALPDSPWNANRPDRSFLFSIRGYTLPKTYIAGAPDCAELAPNKENTPWHVPDPEMEIQNPCDEYVRSIQAERLCVFNRWNTMPQS